MLLVGVLSACVQPGEVTSPTPSAPPNCSVAVAAAAATTFPADFVATSYGAHGRPEIHAFRAASADERDAKIAAIERAGAHVATLELDDTYTTQAIDDPVYLGDAPGAPPGQYGVDKVHAEAAWGSIPLQQGQGVVVAVVDTGVQADHPDLTGRVLAGTDFVPTVAPTVSDPVGDPNTVDGTIDRAGHGTHVAGILGASDNTIGGIGIAPQVQILPVRVLDKHGSGSTESVVNGLTWAADHGANVINLSLGATSPSCAMLAAVQYAVSQGVVVVAAGGNAGCVLPDPAYCKNKNPPLYPGAYAPAVDGLLAVAATDVNDARASYSNVNTYVTIAAPGDKIWSTKPAVAANSGFAAAPPGALYWTLSGTSMATPHVTGVAALVRAKCSALTPGEVETILTSSAQPLLVGGVTPNSFFGAGLVRADNAVAATTAC